MRLEQIGCSKRRGLSKSSAFGRALRLEKVALLNARPPKMEDHCSHVQFRTAFGTDRRLQSSKLLFQTPTSSKRMQFRTAFSKRMQFRTALRLEDCNLRFEGVVLSCIWRRFAVLNCMRLEEVGVWKTMRLEGALQFGRL